MQNLPNPAKAEALFYWSFASKVAERMGFEVIPRPRLHPLHGLDAEEAGVGLHGVWIRFGHQRHRLPLDLFCIA
jgi:hypothetical protein